MNRAECLDAARSAVVERGAAYGPPESNFETIANLWQAYLDGRQHKQILPTDVAAMLMLMKVARLANDPVHLDSWVDSAGYAACGAEVSVVDDDPP